MHSERCLRDRLKYFFTPRFKGHPWWVVAIPLRTQYRAHDVLKIGKLTLTVHITSKYGTFWENITTKFKRAIQGTRLYYWMYEKELEKRRRAREKRANLLGFKTKAFDSFWDYSTGQMIDSQEKLRERIKEGFVAMSQDEMARNAKRIKKEKTDRAKSKRRKELKQAVREIQQGRSFVKEIMERKDKKKVAAFNTPQN